MSLCSICALVALCRFAPYALWSRYVALLHTRSWRGYVLTGVVRIRRAWPLPLPPPHWGGGIKSLRYSRIGAIGRRYGALRIDGLAVS